MKYTKGNTRKQAAEWDFHFVVSDVEKRITDSRVDRFWDLVLDAADECGFSLGGSYKPILDADYEAMEKEGADYYEAMEKRLWRKVKTFFTRLLPF